MKKIMGNISIILAVVVLMTTGCSTVKKTNKAQRGGAIGTVGGEF